MNEPIGDEAIYLRIAQFEKGLIQLTDTTNAYRLFAKYGPDIRYNAPWKKWLVWNGVYWELDDGCLIHDRGPPHDPGDLPGTAANFRLP
jgi:putative DNA primase/helicase